MNKRFIWIPLCLSLFSCVSNKESKVEVQHQENMEAKMLFQGVWKDQNTNQILFQVKGDSIYYLESSLSPVSFKILGDSLVMQGFQKTSYRINQQTDYSFSFSSSLGEQISLRKSEEFEEIATVHPSSLPTYLEKTQKDHVIVYKGTRYRGYSYINPSTLKVFRSELTEEGLEVERIFYDNVIHICVYDGKKRLLGKDITKQLFESLVPADFLEGAILSDMDFVAVDEKGYHYHALVCVPDLVICYQILISISYSGEWKYELVRS
ncbi:MAG: DUF4738 domain-containing protein [Phocaeicola sp.]